MVWTTLNGRRGPNSATSDRMMGYGPVALHVAGTGEVRFRDVAIKDLNRKTEPAEQVSSHFRMQQLNDFFYSWGATAGDINHAAPAWRHSGRDRRAVLLSGPGLHRTSRVHRGPQLQPEQQLSRKAWSTSPTTSPATDGTDIICVDSRPIYLYVNPKGESRRWDRYNVVPNATSEIEVFPAISMATASPRFCSLVPTQ